VSNLFPIDFIIKKLHAPRISNNIIVFNARRCNRDCDFCYIENLPWSQDDFNEKEIDQAFNMLDNISVGLIGGEPFVDKDATETFLHFVNKYHKIINTCYIFSNMDYWDRYKDKIEALPIRVHISVNSRSKTFYKSTKNCEIWNGIFFDELDLDREYPVGHYCFALKNPTFWNNIGDEFHFCFDWDKVEAKIKSIFDAGSRVTVLSSSSFEEYTHKKDMFMQPDCPYVNMVNFPKTFKADYEYKINLCKTCKLECKSAIEDNKCPRLWKECFTCEQVNICPHFSNPKKLLDKTKLRSCDSMRRALVLGEHYRRIQQLYDIHSPI
jgi:hypothetical protein